jgi:uncharacterized protein (DUF1800 family)
MARGNSARRNSAFDLTKAEFIRPQTRLEANRWLDKATFGATTALTDIDASTKTNIVGIGTDEATQLMASTYAQYLDAAFIADPDYSLTDKICVNGQVEYNLGINTFGTNQSYITSNPVDYDDFQRWFIYEGIYGQARARIKATYALSEMIVCRRNTSTANTMTAFVNILFDATKSRNNNSYKDMLKKVTFNKSMATWLTFLNNAKADAAKNTRPDENYGREILQLFSVGLNCLNLDGTPILDAVGDMIPTYLPSYVPESAKFFTGITNIYGVSNKYADRLIGDGFTHEIGAKEAIPYPDGSRAILPAQTYYRFGIDNFTNPSGYVVTKVTNDQFTVQATEVIPFGYDTTLAGGTTIGYSLAPGGTKIIASSSIKDAVTGVVTINSTKHGLTTGTVIYSKSLVEESIDFYLDRLFNHPTTAPFFAKSMIKLLVTSNPTPDYVRRVAQKFLDNGNGVAGDISAVFKAIYLDQECIIPYGKNPLTHGKFTTMFDRFMKTACALRNDSVHNYMHMGGNDWDRIPAWGNQDLPISTTNQAVNCIFTKPRLSRECAAVVPNNAYVYPYPFLSPSVFNFYRPGYVSPKTELADLGLTAPELQVTTSESQSLWCGIVLGATAYGDLVHVDGTDSIMPTGAYSGDLMDPRGNTPRIGGLNFKTTTVTVTTAGTLSGANTVFNATAQLDDAIPMYLGNVTMYHRRLGGYVLAWVYQRPNASGALTLSFQARNAIADRRTQPYSTISMNVANTAFQVGDVLDVAEMFVFGLSGLAGESGTGFQSHITVLHKAATKLPDTATVTDTDLNTGIDYIESILATRPISAEIRQLMKDAANQPIVLPTRTHAAYDSGLLNNYRYMVYGYSQIRIRRMLAVFLVSPEFCTQY